MLISNHEMLHSPYVMLEVGSLDFAVDPMDPESLRNCIETSDLLGLAFYVTMNQMALLHTSESFFSAVLLSDVVYGGEILLS